MEEQVVQALFNCTQADNQLRITSESYLSSLKHSAGFGVLLVQISFNPVYSFAVRQLAAILVKNQCKKWKDADLPAQDKELIKSNLVGCLKLSVEEQVRGQYEEIAYNIGRHEKDLSSLICQIDQSFATDNLDNVYSGLNALFQLTKRYEYVINEKRAGLKPLITHFFDKLLGLLQSLLVNQSFSHINLIVQIFWVCFYLDYFDGLVNESKLDAWFEGFRLILSDNYENIQITDHYEQETKTKDPRYQSKKWVIQIVYRFFSRYHDYKSQIGSNLMIGQLFTGKWVKVFLDISISQTFVSRSVFVPDISLNYYLKYINQAVNYQPTCEYLTSLQIESEHVIPRLITQIITPVVCKTPYDEELWNDNPIEYIRRSSDLSSVLYSASNSCLDLLHTLCSHGYLQQFLSYLLSSLNNQLSPIIKESLMHQIGSVAQIINSEPNLASTIENMLFLHIFPELVSPVGFLKAQACWVYGQFSSINFENLSHQQQVLERLCTLVQDPFLPVKFEAALTLPKVLSWEISRSRVQNEISGVLKIYLDMINEIDSEELIEALEDIVGQYSEQVLPFAVDLARELSNNFLRLVTKEGMGDDDESAMAAVSVLNTIEKITETVSDKTEEVKKISAVVKEVLLYSLSETGAAFMEEGLNLFSQLLYNNKAGDLVDLVPCFSLVISSLTEGSPYGVEKHEEVFPVLANYISKYLIENSDIERLLLFLLDLCAKDLNLTVLSCRLLICLFENLKHKISPFIPAVLEKMTQIVLKSESPKEKTIACQVVYVAIWSDAVSSLNYLESQNTFKSILNYSLNHLKFVKERLSRIQIILALSHLFPLSAQFPASLSNENLSALFKRFVEIILIVEYDEQEESASPFMDAEEFNSRADEIIEKIRGNFEDDDEEVLFETDADEFYDSVFEAIDYKSYVKTEFSKVPQDLLAQLVSTVEEDQKRVLSRFF